MTLNIYLSGPDGARKTTLAYSLETFLRTSEGLRAKIIHFPSEVGVAGGIIGLVRQGRLEMCSEALDMLFVADRLEKASILVEERKLDPSLVFIFDRGPVDGWAYGQARRSRVGEMDYANWLRGCDETFLRFFPVDIGLENLKLLTQMRVAVRDYIINQQGTEGRTRPVGKEF